MITSSGTRDEVGGMEGGSADVPVVIVDDDGEEEELQGEDVEVIGAFSGEYCSVFFALPFCAQWSWTLYHKT